MGLSFFFPEFDFMVEERVRETCAHCPVQPDCLQWALDHDEAGVWGGLTEEQRKALNAGRQRVRCPDCRSESIFSEESSETCIACGLSWSV